MTATTAAAGDSGDVKPLDSETWQHVETMSEQTTAHGRLAGPR